MRSRLVVLALVWGCFGTGILLACGGDDSSSSSSGDTPDASPDVNNPINNTDGSNNPTAPVIVASDITVYTNTTASPDATPSNAQTYAWTVKVVPNGSALTNAGLANATSARPSFRADVSGEYVLEVTAANGTLSSKKDVKVKAVPAPLFYVQSQLKEKPPYFEYRTIGTDGTGGHPVACRINGEADAGDDQTEFFLMQGMLLADLGQDWWEAPNAADPTRVAMVNFDRVDGGSTTEIVASLALGTNTSTCQNAPVKVNPVGGDGGNPSGFNILQPRFNRAGNRVAYLEERESDWYVVTVSYDGKDRRELSLLCEGDGDCWEPSFFPARPQWLNDTTTGWARKQHEDAGSGWEVMVANDSANPQPRVYMTCDGLAPRSIAFLKDGSVIANHQAPDAGSREDLYVLKPNATTKKCEIVRNLTNLPENWSYARDFAVSPDETEVAFVRHIQPGGTLPDGGGKRLGGQVYIAPISGASPPVPVATPAPKTLFGPRYVASATMLAWNGEIEHDGGPSLSDDAGLTDGGLPVIAVMPREAGTITYAARSDIDAGTYLFGGGNGGSCDFRLDLNFCSTGPIPTGGGGLALGLAALGLIVRRRRNRR